MIVPFSPSESASTTSVSVVRAVTLESNVRLSYPTNSVSSEILEEKGLTYDEEGFKKAQEEQRAKSEGTFGTHSYTGKEVSVYDQLDAALETEFVS